MSSVSSKKFQDLLRDPKSRHLLKDRVIAERYSLESFAGSGVFSVVFRARDLLEGNSVAMKFFLPSSIDGENDHKKVSELEISSLGRIRHRNVIRLINSGLVEQEIPFAVLEYIKGITLEDVFYEFGRFSEVHFRKLSQQLCFAIAATKDAGIAHMDVKPTNVMIRDPKEVLDDGSVVLIDFSSSCDDKTRGHGFQGGSEYSAPEARENPGPHCDIYSLGAVLFEVLYGEGTLFYPEDFRRGLYATLGVHPQLHAALSRAMRRDPSMRMQSALEIATVIEGCEYIYHPQHIPRLY